MAKEQKRDKELGLATLAFLRALVAGASQREAYRASHPRSQAGDATVDVMASRLLAKPEVQEKYRQLRALAEAEADKAAVLSANEVLVKLSTMASLAWTEDKDKLRALELLGKHYGLFSDKLKLESDNELRVNIRVVDPDG